MRFQLGPIPASEGFRPAEAGWSKLREPDASSIAWMSVLAGVVGGAAIVACHRLIQPLPPLNFVASAGPRGVLALALLGVATMLLHELLHVLAQPGAGRSAAAVLGLWPAKGVLYAHYDGALARNRSLLVGAAPLVVLSVLPLMGSALLGRGHWIVSTVAAINALGACGDMLGMVLLVAQVPRTALVRNLGYDTWWRDASVGTPTDA